MTSSRSPAITPSVTASATDSAGNASPDPHDPLAERAPGSPAEQLDHPIFRESIRLIRGALRSTASATSGSSVSPAGGSCDGPCSDPAERDVLERLVHSSGDLTLPADLVISPGACLAGMAALAAGAPILTDTAMAAAAVAPMVRRTFANPLSCVLEWAPAQAPPGSTRTAEGMRRALAHHPGALVLIGSAPTALEVLLAQVAADSGGAAAPALVIGMPVGFVGVAESKRHLAASALPQIRLDGCRGGAGLVAAALNALLRRSWLEWCLDQAAFAAASAPASPPLDAEAEG
jgi:precorrin-8X/cobalt-precorrin-8 methylmutase